MELKDLISILNKVYEVNGNIDVVGMVDGEVYCDFDFNVAGEDSPLYLELYK